MCKICEANHKRECKNDKCKEAQADNRPAVPGCAVWDRLYKNMHGRMKKNETK
jgi:hypothetical protein